MNRKQLEKRALELLADHLVFEPPVPVFDIIRDEDVGLFFEELEDDHSGFLLVEGAEADIAINSDHHPNRQRFTAAHELGHLVLHGRGKEDRLFVDKVFFRSDKTHPAKVKKEEMQANQFAAALLMPSEMIEEQIGDGSISDIDVTRLAQLFEVSEQAMTLRLVILGLLGKDS